MAAFSASAKVTVVCGMFGLRAAGAALCRRLVKTDSGAISGAPKPAKVLCQKAKMKRGKVEKDQDTPAGSDAICYSV